MVTETVGVRIARCGLGGRVPEARGRRSTSAHGVAGADVGGDDEAGSGAGSGAGGWRRPGAALHKAAGVESGWWRADSGQRAHARGRAIDARAGR